MPDVKLTTDPLSNKVNFIFVDPTNGRIVGESDSKNEITAYKQLKETEKFQETKLLTFKLYEIESTESIDSLINQQKKLEEDSTPLHTILEFIKSRN